MDSLKHSSLLREIGVDWYIPRIPLAVIQNSLAKIVVSPVMKTDEKPLLEPVMPSDIAKPALRKAKPDIDFGLDELKPSQSIVSAEVKTPKVAAIPKAEIEKFNLLVSVSGSLVCVSDVKTNPLSAVWERSVKQFFDELQLSYDVNKEARSSINYFSWPLPGHTKMNIAEEQLGQLLNGFMQQRISGACKIVILFGDSAQRHVGSLFSDDDFPTIIKAPALGKMFTISAYKSSLWKDLQALNTDGP
jgi:hypothetical protein